MDADVDKNRLESELLLLQNYLKSPITTEILRDNEGQQQALIELLCNRTIVDVPTFFGHFEAIGHLRGLRRAKAIITDKVDEIENQLKELPQ